jgi:hypothetical protein
MAEAFSTYGLIAAHYQFADGDRDPVPDPEHPNLAGGKLLTETAQENRGSRTLTLANVRSGWSARSSASASTGGAAALELSSRSMNEAKRRSDPCVQGKARACQPLSRDRQKGRREGEGSRGRGERR